MGVLGQRSLSLLGDILPGLKMVSDCGFRLLDFKGGAQLYGEDSSSVACAGWF